MQNKDIVCKTCWIQISDHLNAVLNLMERQILKNAVFVFFWKRSISQNKGAMSLSKSQSILIMLILVLICQFFIISV